MKNKNFSYFILVIALVIAFIQEFGDIYTLTYSMITFYCTIKLVIMALNYMDKNME